MLKKSVILHSTLLLLLLLQFSNTISAHGAAGKVEAPLSSGGRSMVVTKEERRILVSTDFGEISAVEIGAEKGPYHLQFITLEANALFLPAILHADMVFYVDTGSGQLSWSFDDETRNVKLRRGDVYRLPPGTAFFIRSNLEPGREKLRIYAIFDDANDYYDPSIGMYSGVADMVLGFDKKILQAAFKVPEDVIEELLNTTRGSAIVHAVSSIKEVAFWETEARLLKSFFGISRSAMENKKKKVGTFNILKEDPDYKNCYGWSSIVTKRRSDALKGSDIGIFMVNLTKGSMMGPHWNPRASEMAIAIEGRGVVRMVSPSCENKGESKNRSFMIEEGDVFSTARFHPMAQMSFNDGPFVFVGFTTTTKKNHPQFLAGKSSVLQVLDRQVLAASFNVDNSTIDKLLAAQDDSTIFECISCAEEEEILIKEERRRKEQEERERKREEEERKRKEEEERERKREEEERKRKEEEERERKREEEERRRKEEEERRRKEEEERRRKEEEERRRKEEEERERKREEEERRKEEEEREREEEEREREEEERRRKEEEERKREREEEERRGEEERERQRQEEEERERERARQEEEAKREEEAATRQREEEERREAEEEVAKQKEEKERREAEEAARQREEEERRREAEEEEARKREEEEVRQREEKERSEAEEEEARHRKKEERREAEEEEAREREEEERRGEAEEERAREREAEERERRDGQRKRRGEKRNYIPRELKQWKRNWPGTTQKQRGKDDHVWDKEANKVGAAQLQKKEGRKEIA